MGPEQADLIYAGIKCPLSPLPAWRTRGPMFTPSAELNKPEGSSGC